MVQLGRSPQSDPAQLCGTRTLRGATSDQSTQGPRPQLVPQVTKVPSNVYPRNQVTKAHEIKSKLIQGR